MLRPWPPDGAWFVAPTSAAVDRWVAVAALAATSRVRVATVVLPGPVVVAEEETEPGGVAALRQADVDTRVEVREGDGKDVVALVRTLRQTHPLVLVVAPGGLQVPLDGDKRTALDLARMLEAPVVLVSRPGPDLTNHVTLALAALDAAHLVATVLITDEETAEDGSPAGPDPYEGLPLRPSGRIPGLVPAGADAFAVAARGWLNPLLQAGADVDAEQVRAAAVPPGPVYLGRRVVLSLAVVFAVMVLVVIGLAMLGGEDDDRASTAQPALYRISAGAPPTWSPRCGGTTG